MIIFAVVIQMKMKRWFKTAKEVEANNSHSEGNLLLECKTNVKGIG